MGLRTIDGKEHKADVVIMACGGWTPSVVPEVAGIVETAAGSVVMISLPKIGKISGTRSNLDAFLRIGLSLYGRSHPRGFLLRHMV